jgi:hypothetical protein
MAGAATGGFLSLRSGLRPAFRSAVVGGLLLVSQGRCCQRGQPRGRCCMGRRVWQLWACRRLQLCKRTADTVYSIPTKVMITSHHSKAVRQACC